MESTEKKKRKIVSLFRVEAKIGENGRLKNEDSVIALADDGTVWVGLLDDLIKSSQTGGSGRYRVMWLSASADLPDGRFRGHAPQW